MKLEENKDLSLFNTLKVGGKAKFFVRVKNDKDVFEALSLASQKKAPVLILGGGSNIFFKDKYLNALVIKNEIKGIEVLREYKNKVLIKVGAGEGWDSFVKHTVEKSLYGLENLSGIPGTVGGSPIQNIGAYGVEVSSCTDKVFCVDTKTHKLKVFKNSECNFAYRDSVFKKYKNRYIVLYVSFVLSKEFKPIFTYKDILEYFKNKTPKSAKEIRKAILEIRKRKFPDLKNNGTAGSFFKNIVLSKKEVKLLLQKFPETPSFEMENRKMKIPTGFVLDKICGLKGFREGNVGLYENQSLVLVNFGEASAKEIFDFKEKIKKIVFKKTGLKIEEEVIII